MGFPDGSVGKNLPTNARDRGCIPGSARPSGEGNGNPLQYSCLGNAMDRGAWRATAHEITKSCTLLSTHAYTLSICACVYSLFYIFLDYSLYMFQHQHIRTGISLVSIYNIITFLKQDYDYKIFRFT